MPQRLSMDGIKQIYTEDKWILLLPAVSKFMGTDNPIWGLDVTEVEINPDSPSMVYDQKGKDALTKIALDKLASAAGISVQCRRTDDRSNRDLAAFEATAILRTPGGEPIMRTATREWDGKDAMDRIQIECENYVEKNQRGLSDEAFGQAVQRRFREESLREREISRAKTETKAINRAIAMVLGIPRSFPRGVLKTHKFAIVKYVMVPDMSDPVVKQAVIAASIGAHAQLYAGPPAALPAPVQDARAGADDGLDPVIGSEAERAEYHPAERTTVEPQGVADTRAMLGEGPAQAVRADGRTAAPGWDAVQEYDADIRRLLAESKHPKIAEVKAKYLRAWQERDAQKATDIYNWLLDQSLLDGGTR